MAAASAPGYRARRVNRCSIMDRFSRAKPPGASHNSPSVAELRVRHPGDGARPLGSIRQHRLDGERDLVAGWSASGEQRSAMPGTGLAVRLRWSTSRCVGRTANGQVVHGVSRESRILDNHVSAARKRARAGLGYQQRCGAEALRRASAANGGRHERVVVPGERSAFGLDLGPRSAAGWRSAVSVPWHPGVLAPDDAARPSWRRNLDPPSGSTGHKGAGS